VVVPAFGATTTDNIEKLHQIDNRRIKVREIAEALGISKKRVCHTSSEELSMRNLTARWVPRLLTLDQKQIPISKALLEWFKRSESDSFRQFITVDETWIHRNTPETKQPSKQWTAKGETAPKKAKTVSSTGKVMTAVFGIVMKFCSSTILKKVNQ
jgi:hypothetical protein